MSTAVTETNCGKTQQHPTCRVGLKTGQLFQNFQTPIKPAKLVSSNRAEPCCYSRNFNYVAQILNMLLGFEIS